MLRVFFLCMVFVASLSQAEVPPSCFDIFQFPNGSVTSSYLQGRTMRRGEYNSAVQSLIVARRRTEEQNLQRVVQRYFDHFPRPAPSTYAALEGLMKAVDPSSALAEAGYKALTDDPAFSTWPAEYKNYLFWILQGPHERDFWFTIDQAIVYTSTITHSNDRFFIPSPLKLWMFGPRFLQPQTPGSADDVALIGMHFYGSWRRRNELGYLLRTVQGAVPQEDSTLVEIPTGIPPLISSEANPLSIHEVGMANIEEILRHLDNLDPSERGQARNAVERFSRRMSNSPDELYSGTPNFLPSRFN